MPLARTVWNRRGLLRKSDYQWRSGCVPAGRFVGNRGQRAAARPSELGVHRRALPWSHLVPLVPTSPHAPSSLKSRSCRLPYSERVAREATLPPPRRSNISRPRWNHFGRDGSVSVEELLDRVEQKSARLLSSPSLRCVPRSKSGTASKSAANTSL